MSENASAWADLTGRTLTKGQGTGNDFIFITDPKAEAVLDAATPMARSQKCAGTVCAPSLSICAPRG